MIDLTKISNPSKLVSDRASAMWATRLYKTNHEIAYKVTPHSARFDHKNKSRRLVVFNKWRGTAECWELLGTRPLRIGAQCEANMNWVPEDPERFKRGQLCSHVLAAYRIMEKSNKRREAA